MAERRDKLITLGLALLGFALSALWALVNPVYEAPDEPEHTQYVSYVLTMKGLPVQESPLELKGEGHQHPLYYVLAASLLKVTGANWIQAPEVVVSEHPRVVNADFASDRDRWEVYLLRLCGSLMLGFSVWLLAGTSRRLIPGGAWIVPPLLLATLPQVSFITGAINNDAPTLLCGVGAFSALLFAYMGEGSWVTAGIWCGVGFLVKKSLGLYCALGGILVLMPQHRKDWWRFYAPMMAGVLPILIRNWVLYKEFLGTGMEERTLPELVVKKGFDSPYWGKYFFPLIWPSSIGQFGWMNIGSKDWIYYTWTIFLLPGLGALRFFKKPFIWLAAVVCITAFLLLVQYNMTYNQPQGRLLWPALGAFMLLVGFGYSKLAAAIKVRPLIFIVVLGLGTVCMNWLCLSYVNSLNLHAVR